MKPPSARLPTPQADSPISDRPTNMFVFSIPAGTDVPSHTAPHPYVSIVLSGTVEIVASDGVARRFNPGELLFCNDLTGKGHVTRAITDAVAAFVNRPGA